MRIVYVTFLALLLGVSGVTYSQESDPVANLSELRGNSNYSVQIDQAKLDTIKTNCDNSKSILKTTSKKIDSAIKKRQLLYGDIQKESKAIEIRLNRQGVDASEIDLLIGKNQQNIEDLTKANIKFQEVAGYLDLINCRDNPELYYFGVRFLKEILSEMERGK